MKHNMIKLLLATAALTLAVGCTSQTDAERALTGQGFTDIKMTGYSMLACSEDDFFSTGFEATNAQGKRVTGTVCSGLLFKSATIRY